MKNDQQLVQPILVSLLLNFLFYVAAFVLLALLWNTGNQWIFPITLGLSYVVYVTFYVIKFSKTTTLSKPVLIVIATFPLLLSVLDILARELTR